MPLASLLIGFLLFRWLADSKVPGGAVFRHDRRLLCHPGRCGRRRQSGSCRALARPGRVPRSIVMGA